MGWFRRPRTRQEKQAAIGSPLRVRAKRKSLTPTSWDDINVAARYDRSWKKYRKHQWRYQHDT
jgi:hypothetical protein